MLLFIMPCSKNVFCWGKNFFRKVDIKEVTRGRYERKFSFTEDLGNPKHSRGLMQKATIRTYHLAPGFPRTRNTAGLEDTLELDLLEFLVEHFNHNAALQLIGSGLATVLRSPWRGQQRDRNKLLQMTQVTLCMLLLHRVQNSIVDLLGSLYCLEITRDAIRTSPLHSVGLIKLHEGNWSVHITISVATDTTVHSVDKVRVTENRFHLFQSNVFTTLELDEILLAVDNAKATIFHELSNISSVEPSICPVFFLAFIFHHVVSRSDIGTSNAYFTTSPDGVAFYILAIRREVGQASLVLDFWRRVELSFTRRKQDSSNTCSCVFLGLNGQSSASLSQTLRRRGDYRENNYS